MALSTPQNRFTMMSMGVGTWLIPPVLYLAGSVVQIVRIQLIGSYLLALSFTIPPAGPPILLDATYFIIRRFVRGQFVYYTERMDDRLWQVAEDCWCVDAGLAYPLFAPQATLTASAANGNQNITSYIVIQGGTTANITGATMTINDLTGSGATGSLTVAGGLVTAVVPGTTGSLYINPSIVVQDQTGAVRPDVIIQPVITNYITMTTDNPVFAMSQIGNVIRMSGGIATIVAYGSSTSVTVNVTTPINKAPNDPGDQPIPAASGAWTMGVPTSQITGLNHLEGLMVTGLADGNVITPREVVNGAITLDQAATMITVGLPYTVQIQSLYLDAQTGGPGTMQGKRKDIFSVTARVENSRGFAIGTNQVDSSTTPNNAVTPWTNLVEWTERQPANVNAGNALPLFTGDAYKNVRGSWRKQGQVAVQQSYPLPLNLLALIPSWTLGDDDGA